MFLKISQNSKRNTCVRVYFSIKCQDLGLKLYQKCDLDADVSCEFYEILKSTFFCRTPPVAEVQKICSEIPIEWSFWETLMQDNDNLVSTSVQCLLKTHTSLKPLTIFSKNLHHRHGPQNPFTGHTKKFKQILFQCKVYIFWQSLINVWSQFILGLSVILKICGLDKRLECLEKYKVYLVLSGNLELPHDYHCGFTGPWN